MKQILILTLVILSFSNCSIFDGELRKQTTIQTYAKCDACKDFLESSLMSKKGIVFVELDLEKERIKIQYDAKLLSEDEVRKLVASKGFKADDLAPNKSVMEQLPNCCQLPQNSSTN